MRLPAIGRVLYKHSAPPEPGKTVIVSLAPYHVPWAISACALLLLALSLCWLLAHDMTVRVMARLSTADGIAFWLTFTAAYQTFRTLRLHELAIGDGHLSVWLLWAGMAAYLALRLIPTPLRREPVVLAVALVLWAWSIGAGYQYVETMAQRANLLRINPGVVLSTGANSAGKVSIQELVLESLRGALALERLGEESKAQVASLVLDLDSGKEINMARSSALRQVLIPEVLEHYRRDLNRLHTYQVLQILLLCAVLLAWGFGRMSGD